MYEVVARFSNLKGPYTSLNYNLSVQSYLNGHLLHSLGMETALILERVIRIPTNFKKMNKLYLPGYLFCGFRSGAIDELTLHMIVKITGESMDSIRVNCAQDSPLSTLQ